MQTQTHSRWQWLLVIVPGGLIALGAWRAWRRDVEQRDEA